MTIRETKSVTSGESQAKLLGQASGDPGLGSYIGSVSSQYKACHHSDSWSAATLDGEITLPLGKQVLPDFAWELPTHCNAEDLQH